MGVTYTDFSQLSKGMFRKNAPVTETKPAPKKSANDGEDALAYFGLSASRSRPGERGAAPGHDAAAVAALEARVQSSEAKIAALGAERDAAVRKADNLERLLADECAARQGAESECDRFRDELRRISSELEDAQTAPKQDTAVAPVIHQLRVAGLLKSPAIDEVFEGEVREHILAALAEALEAAQSSERERRAKVLADVLAANQTNGELESRRKELKQIIKDTGSFVDARTIAALARIGFRCVSGNKHWKLDYANVRIPISKTPSDWRSALNAATDISNRCF